MDRYKDSRQTDVDTDRQRDGHTDKQVCRLTDKEIDRWKNAQTDRWTDGWVKKQWTGAQIAGIQMDRHTDGQGYR